MIKKNVLKHIVNWKQNNTKRQENSYALNNLEFEEDSVIKQFYKDKIIENWDNNWV